MSKSRSYAGALRAVAKELKLAAVWNGSKESVDSYSNDYVFEQLCLFHVAAAAKHGFALLLAGKASVDRRGNPIARWPKKSGHKRNFSFFVLRALDDGGESFQLCPGIRIVDIHGKARAPDANLLSEAAPDFPTHEHVKACWDAKFSSDLNARLPDTSVSDFIHTFRQLGAPRMPASWKAIVRVAAFADSGLLTNANESTEPDATLAASGIVETSGFPNKARTRP